MFFYNDPYESSTNDTCAMIQRKHEELANLLYTTVPKCDKQHEALWHLSQCMNISVITLKLHVGKAVAPHKPAKPKHVTRICRLVRDIMKRAAERLTV